MTMPPNLFYPTTSNVCILTFRAHIPHSGKVWFCRIDNDGMKIYRKKRVEREGEQLTKAMKMFKSRTLNLGIETEVGFSCFRELDPNDHQVEFAPEAYLDSPQYSEAEIQSTIDQLLRDFAAFNIRYADKLKGTRNDPDN